MDAESVCRKLPEIEEDSFEVKFIFAGLGCVFFFEGFPDFDDGFAGTGTRFVFVGDRFLEECMGQNES